MKSLRCFWNVRFITLSMLPRYTAQMLRRFIPPMLSLWLLFASLAQANGTVDKIQIKGLDKGDDVEMMKNITVSLSLYSVVGKEQGEFRLEYLLSQAEFQTRQALEPFGYYAPTIRIDAPRQNDHITVVIYVDKGEPVRVRQAHVAMTGAAAQDHYLQRDLEDFKPKLGEIFNHPTYEASKVRITRRLAERGYFDADFTHRRVEVTRAAHAADIDLIWESGRRYDMGPVRFHYDYFHEGLFNPLVYWDEGSYFHEGKLDRLRESLTKLDYFSSIDIQPKPEEADPEGNVPVDVKLERAKSKIYTAGISYGSESGAGLRAGVERRYMNARGHKMNARLDYAQNLKSLTTAYQIPAFKWLDGWYIFFARAYDEQTKYIDLRNVKLSAARSGQINRHLTATASLNALRERWRYRADDGTNTVAYQQSTLVYPQLEASYVDVDDATFPRNGSAATVLLRGGASALGSKSNFTQLHGQLRWFHGLGASSRLILRGEAGTTWASDLVAMPPSLRFFAGGVNSIRGYAFREVGPRTAKPDAFALGAKHVFSAGAEFEYYYKGGPFGGAVFVDSGSAFNRYPDWHTGVGIGLRYRSPVGPVRVDIARGLNSPDSKIQLYIDIGANL
ncbi:membrane protein [Xylella fastidiosa 32]|nr:membrane protein [Xylella fastidiosa 32]